MAINNTNTIETELGVSISSSYIRLEIYLGTGSKTEVGFHVYPSREDYLNGKKMINNVLDFNLKNFSIGILSSNETTLDNITDLSITELVNRGWDGSKLSKEDLS